VPTACTSDRATGVALAWIFVCFGDERDSTVDARRTDLRSKDICLVLHVSLPFAPRDATGLWGGTRPLPLAKESNGDPARFRHPPETDNDELLWAALSVINRINKKIQ